MKNKLDRHYVSELDQFLAEFDTEHPEKSESQQVEIKKHLDIATRRDQQIHSKPQKD